LANQQFGLTKPYFRFTLSIRDVEQLLAQRGIEASREAVPCSVIKFGPFIAANLRRRRSPQTGRWHLDEMVIKLYMARPERLELPAL
jgi:putative transposase